MGSAQLWSSVLGEIEVSITHGSFVTWFKNTEILEHSDGQFVIGTPNVFVKQQLERKFIPLITETLQRLGVESPQISFKTSARLAAALKDKKPRQKASDQSANAPLFAANTTVNSPAAVRPNTTPKQPKLNDRYTFDSFIVGSGNELAHAACQAIADSPGMKYNPLFIYGGSGLGKTHLIQAVGNHILQKTPGANVVYINTEQFVQEFLHAIRFKKNTDFVNFYRSADALIVDDIQFIAGKEKTQEAFFHTFNALHQANKQIIISSDKPPGEIPTLEDRLRSRFAWGMSVDMQTPDFETRSAIIQTKASQHSVELPQDVVDFLAERFTSNIRELEGALNQLLAFCEMRNLSPDVTIATSLLGANKPRAQHLSPKRIIERTAKYFSISTDDILGPKRDKNIVLPRQVAMYMLRNELHLSFPRIAQELGRKDHTTAMHSVEKIEKESSFNSDLRKAVNEIKERLYV